MIVTVTYSFEPREIPQMISAAIESMHLVPQLIGRAMGLEEEIEEALSPTPNYEGREEDPPQPFVQGE